MGVWRYKIQPLAVVPVDGGYVEYVTKTNIPLGANKQRSRYAIGHLMLGCPVYANYFFEFADNTHAVP